MHSVLAVAANTIRQAIRLKIAVVFILLLLILLPLMGFGMTGDGTVKGRLQSFVSYGLSLTAFLLSILTIVSSIYTLSSDIEQKQIFMVLTKPVRRFELILGKLFGILLLDFFLLGLFSVIIYSIAVVIPSYYKVNGYERERLDNEFFTARNAVTPELEDVSKEVDAAFEILKKDNQLAEGLAQDRNFYKGTLEELTKRKQLEKGAVSPGDKKVWEFHDIKPMADGENIFIRFKYDVSATPMNNQVFSRWEVGDIRQLGASTRTGTPMYRFERKDAVRTFFELKVPADALAEDGYIAVTFYNAPSNGAVVIFSPQEGLALLYKADIFLFNYIRAALLIFAKLIFLGALGILSATFLSFPVAIMLCFLVFFTGTISGFVLDSFDMILSDNVSMIYSYSIKLLIQAFPQFDKFNAAKYIVSAALLDWSSLGKAFAGMVFIRSTILVGLSLLIFRGKEIAKIIV